MRSAIAPLAAVAVLLAVSGCDKTRIVTQVDAGPLCGDGEHLVNGECRFVCNRDGDCPSGERCDLLTGQCVTRPAPVDSGVPVIPCTEGAVRCAVDNSAVERCDATGAWVADTQCPQPDGYCSNEVCLACRPESTKCAASGTVVQICAADGSAYRDVTCATPATCVGGECRECDPGQRRCSPDGKSVQECRKLPREDLSWGYVNAGDNFDGTCITQVCQMGGSGPQCKAPDCVPGSTQCLNATTQQQCGPTGSYQNVTCASLPNMGPTAECLNGACVDECGDASRDKSYFGCEYWSAVVDNSLDPLFKGGTQSGQGTTDSDFVFVVTNQSTSPAQVEVWRYSGSAPVRLKNVTLPGRNDATTHGLMKIAVPWQSIGPASAQVGVGTSGKARYGYRLTSTKPVTVYQFNPVDAVKYTKSCSGTAGLSDCSCDEMADFDSFSCFLGLGGDPGICANTASGKRCAYNTYSNDASLLLPAHILGTSYVVVGVQHIQTDATTPSTIMSPVMTVVATQDNTQVTVKSSASTAAGTGVAAFAAGESRTITLNAYEVLQLATTNRTGVNLQCSGGWCRVNNDFTGTVVTSDKPIAVFSGSPCDQVPFDRSACDHVEEQLFPFETWGKNFVAVPSHPLRLNNNSFASNPPPDHFKIVAACPASQCPNGTTITLSSAPAASAVLAPNNCVSGTSLTANNCRLMGGQYIEFQSRNPFTVTADQPIAVAQFLPGQGSVTGASTDPAEGDPSMILLPPVEQWRSRYTVLASTGLRDNYLSLSIDSAKVQAVTVDGIPVNLTPGPLPSDAKQVAGTGFITKQHPVGTGTHTISVTAKPGQTVLPGAGVTVYGYDSYVSYGYTGGLDLTTIVTGINPGG